MANDASNLPQNATDADMTAGGDHAEFDAVQLAQADAPQQPKTAPAIPAVPNGTVSVDLPQGEKVVRVAVANGETVILPAPFDDKGDLAAKQGNGNLAIKVGDVTVILEGYQQTVDASGNPTVHVKDAQGDEIDVAVVLASTDPNLDITTAAGPAAGAQGADNTGGILTQFGLGAGLGGLNAVGVLDQTALQYKLIDNAIRQERGEELSPVTPGLIIVPGSFVAGNEKFLHDPNIHLDQMQGHLTFEEFFVTGFTDSKDPNVQHGKFDNSYADFDGSAATPGDITGVTGINFFTVDTQNNASATALLTTDGLEQQGLTSNGVPLHYELSADGTTIFAFRGDGSTSGDGALIFVLHIKAGDVNGSVHNFEVDSYLTNRLDNVDANGNPVDASSLNVTFDITTSADQTGSGTVEVHFIDDAPAASDDSYNLGNLSKADVPAGVEGNDKFGADGIVDGKGGVIGVEAGSHPTDTVTTGVGQVIQGAFGKLTLNADGSYSYTRDNPDSTDGSDFKGSDKFTYTIKDDDGDPSTAVLTINIDDHGVIVIPPPPPHDGDNPIDLNKSGTAVFEAGLSDGSDPAADTEKTSGSVKVTAQDGVATVIIDGTKIALDGTPTTITGQHGDLVVTWDKANNEIDYSYTLTDNDLDHSQPGNDIIPGEDFKIIVTDKDGDSNTGDIKISIVDDVPDAKDDTDLVDNMTNKADGNVVTGIGTTSGAVGADVKGADGASVTKLVGFNGSTDSTASDGLKVDGQYGTLEMNADGTYTYTRNANTPGGYTETFKYTLTDGDGDSDTATLTISVGDDKPTVHVPTVEGQTTVYEKGLPAGSGELADGNPSNNSDKSETVSGTITYTEGDAPATITIQGKDGPVAVTVGATIVGADGTLVIDSVGGGNIGYTYTLTTNTSGDATHDDFKVVVTDVDGDPADGTLAIKIVDDVPTAKNDTDLVDAKTNKADGNVITGADTTSGAAGADVKGADGATVTKLVGVTTDSNASDGLKVDGQYGTLEMSADGTYTYTRNAGTPGGVTDTFTYTLTDGDGDPSTATLKIDIGDDKPTVHVPTVEGQTTVYEKGLPAGSGELADGNPSNNSDKSETVSGTITYTEGDAPATITIQGKDGPVAVTVGATIVGADGTLVIDSVGGGNIGYTYTLTTNTSGDTTHDDFKVVVTDSDGDPANGTLVIKIVDDVPTAHDDTDLVSNTTNKADGNVITGADTTSGAAGADVKGADGATVTKLVGVTTDSTPADGFSVTGQYGTLTMDKDGNYTYTRFNGDPLKATDTFTYTITDGDGDPSTATLKVTIDDDGCHITDLTPKTSGGDVTVDEDDLAASRGVGESAGTDATPESTTQSGDFTINAPDGVNNLTVGGHDVIVNGVFTATTFTTGFGNTMSITGYDSGTGKISYSYTLLDNENHPTGNGQNSLFEDLDVKLTDKDGDAATGTLSVNIVDDVPLASDGAKVMGTDVQKNNVLLVIDTTGSMDVPYPTSSSTTNKLQFEVQACMNLLNAYLAAGGDNPANLRVQIVTFNVSATNQTTQWIPIDQAITILTAISQLTPNGNTNYDDAITHILSNFAGDTNAVYWNTGGVIPDGTNSAYFFSDGIPNLATPGDGNPGLNGTQLTQWISYLIANQVNAYAIGMGAPNGSAEDAQLDIVAYNGQGTGTDTQSINVTDPNQLSAMIIDTIGTNSGGNLVGDLGAKYGADGPGGVNSISLEGKTYTLNGTAIVTTGSGSGTATYDAATHVLVITTSNGVLEVNMATGTYEYQQAGGSHANVLVNFTLIDADGDVSNTGNLYLLSPVPVIAQAADPVVPTLLSTPVAPTAADFDAAHTKTGTGADGDNLTGTAQADYLNGGGGADTMTGLGGNDVYVVSQTNDTVVEAANAGIDTVLTTDDYTLAPNVENLFLQGSGGISGTGNGLDNVIVGNGAGNNIYGLAGNDQLFGGAGTDRLEGGTGNDYLDGGTGNDQMLGGAGNDVYVVDSSKDAVTENFNQGTDTVLSSINYTLGTNVEHLVLTGSGNINGTGNELDNTIVGNAGNNVLDGGSGNDILVGDGGTDQMSGGAGNDQFLKVDAADLSSGKIDGGAGDDLVDLSQLATFKSGDTSHITNVEVLSFQGGSGTAVTLDYNSVLGMTDTNNNLVIHGDQGSDTVALSGGFTKIGTDITANDGAHYDVFQAGSGASLVTVFVDHNLNATAN